MNLLMFSLLMGAPGGEGAGSAAWVNFIPFGLIIVIFYFFMIRPQNKKQKETQRMLNALKKGDKVVTIGGLHGVIQSVKDNTVIIKADEFTKLEFSRQAVASVTLEGKGEAKEVAGKGDKSEKEEKKAAASEPVSGTAEETKN